MSAEVRLAPAPGGGVPAPVPTWLAELPERVHAARTGYFRRHDPAGRARGRESAVLMLYGPAPGGGEDVVLTERSPHLRSHAGQVAFPGGRIDPGDAGPTAAALREACEEVGLDASGVRILGELPELYLSASGSSVVPVLAWWERPGPIGVHSPDEVARVERVRVADLLDPARRFTAVHPSGYRAPAFEVSGLFVWGFTAALLSATFDLAGLDPGGWDADVRRPVPEVGVPRRRDCAALEQEDRS